MKPVIALDLSLFAIPNVAENSAEVEDILGRIQAWASAVDKQDCVIFATVSDAVDVLREANCYPATHNVRALLELHDLGHVFSANDVSTRIFSIMQKAQRLPDVMDSEVLEFSNAVIEGVEVPADADAHLVRSWELLLASVAHSGNNLARVSGAYRSSREIVVEGFVEMVERTSGIDLVGSLHIKAPVIVIDGPADYLHTLDPADIWKHADDGKQLHLAISLEIAKSHSLQTTEIPVRGVPNFCVGSDFLTSLRRHGALDAGTLANLVRSKCAQTIFSKEQAAPKSFDAVREGDAAGSFRVHLSKDHAAFRLMYWVRPDGVIEFANIGVKNELKIFEGNCHEHISCRYN